MNLFPSTAVAQLVYSNASGTGCASVLTEASTQTKLVVNRMFTRQEAKESSTERELLAMLYGLGQHKGILAGKSVNWHTDAKSMVRIVRRGSTKRVLANLAVAIFILTKTANINLIPIWVPRTENEEADLWSRVRDYNDWGVLHSWFHKITDEFGVTCTIDRMADNDNKKLPQFNSRFFHTSSEAIDCFTQD